MSHEKSASEIHHLPLCPEAAGLLWWFLLLSHAAVTWAHSWCEQQRNSGQGLGVSLRTSEETGPRIVRTTGAAFYASRVGGVTPILKLTTGFQAVCSDMAGGKGWEEQGGRHTPAPHTDSSGEPEKHMSAQQLGENRAEDQEEAVLLEEDNRVPSSRRNILFPRGRVQGSFLERD